MAVESLLLNIVTFDGSVPANPFSSEEFQNKIFPNGFYDFIIQIIAFIILLLIVFFLAYKPVRKLLRTRAEYVEKQIAEAEAKNRIASEAAAKKDEIVDSGKETADKIIADARKQAELEASKIIADAQKEAEAKKRQADIDIELAKEKSKQEIHNEIVDVALLASSQLLGREVSQEDNRRLVGDFVDSLSESEKKGL
ncbi:MAG: F0F1 ATP synthase subunit B [Bacilli bacterium]|nr:F0F1 ATP synthase subunit B [Bacilli bacterium]